MHLMKRMVNLKCLRCWSSSGCGHARIATVIAATATSTTVIHRIVITALAVFRRAVWPGQPISNPSKRARNSKAANVLAMWTSLPNLEGGSGCDAF